MTTALLETRDGVPFVDIEARFMRAISAIEAIVGAQHLVYEKSRVESLSQDIIPQVHAPVAFVYPGSVDEVIALVKLANQYQLPLWPTSKGKNWGYGAATPAQSGAIVLFLERMNRIIEVNEEMGHVVVEPGVTYRQLHEHLRERNIPLWLDCTDGPADGSVMGNALERGIGETDYGDHFGNICGMEAVLPDGALIRTGGGPMSGYKSWNAYKWGVGPYLEGLFSQSNYGVVTKIGMWLMPKPEYFTSCVFELTREEDFPALMDAMRRLQFSGAIKSKVHIVNDVVTFALVAEPHEILGDAKFLTDARRAELRKKYNIAPWSFAAGLYGTREQVKANISLIMRKLGPLGTMQFIDDRRLELIKALTRGLRAASRFPAAQRVCERIALAAVGKPVALLETMPHVHAIEKGYPSDFFVKHAYYRSRRAKPTDDDIDPARDRCGLIWIGPMVPLNGRDMSDVVGMVRPLYVKYGFDFTTALIVGNPRTVVALMSVFFDKEDPDETGRAEALYYAIGEVTQRAGYQAYRASTMYMSKIMEPAPEFQDLCNRIKGALDPRGILAPGKYGIDVPAGA